MPSKGVSRSSCVIAALALAVPRFQGARHGRRQPERATAGSGFFQRSGTGRVHVHRGRAAPLSESITATGSLLAGEGVTLAGRERRPIVTAIYFKEGAQVRKGDLLVKLNDLELRAMRDRASHRRELAAIRERRIQQLIGKGVARQEEFDAASNERKVQDAEVALIVAQIEKTEIRAPFDGIVGLRYVSEGAFLTTATRVATLQRVADLKLEFSLPETIFGARSHGHAADVHGQRRWRSPSRPGLRSRPANRYPTRTVRVRAICTNPSGRLLPGNFATIELQLSTLANALLVPATAILMGAGEKSVFVLVAGKAMRRAITTGMRLEDRVQILSGLAAGRGDRHLGPAADPRGLAHQNPTDVDMNIAGDRRRPARADDGDFDAHRAVGGDQHSKPSRARVPGRRSADARHHHQLSGRGRRGRASSDHRAHRGGREHRGRGADADLHQSRRCQPSERGVHARHRSRHGRQ